MSSDYIPAGADLAQLFIDKYKKELREMPPANIIIAGKTGVGKSTLVNSVFREKMVETGSGLPVTKGLQKLSRDDMPIVLYDSRGFELGEEIRREVEAEICQLIDSKRKSGRIGDYIHLAWYVINSQSHRIEEYELKFMHELSEKIPVIVVLSKSLADADPEMVQVIAEHAPFVKAVIPVLAEEYRINNEITIAPKGLVELIDSSLALIPEQVRRSLVNAQKVNIKAKKAHADKAVIKYISAAFATGFTPIPFADAAVLVPMQIGMLAHLTSIFGLNFDKALISSLAASVAGTGGAVYLGRSIVSGLFKLFPGFGSAAGGMITGTTAAVITAALGYAYNSVMAKVLSLQAEKKTVSNKEMAEMLKDEYQEHLKKLKDFKSPEEIAKGLQGDKVDESELKQLSEPETPPFEQGDED